MSNEPSTTGDDVLSCLARIDPGYIELTEKDGSTTYLFVLDFPMAPGFTVSVGFGKDIPGTEDLGQPVFLHKRMAIRHLGTAQQYLDDELVQRVLLTLEDSYPVANLGLLPLVRACEWIRSGRVSISDTAAIVGIPN